MVNRRLKRLVVEFHHVCLFVFSRFQRHSEPPPPHSGGEIEVACQVSRTRVDGAVGKKSVVAGKGTERHAAFQCVRKATAESVVLLVEVAADKVGSDIRIYRLIVRRLVQHHVAPLTEIVSSLAPDVVASFLHISFRLYSRAVRSVALLNQSRLLLTVVSPKSINRS